MTRPRHATRPVRSPRSRRIFERDGHRCHYCDKVVDASLPNMHPDAPSIDHKQPRSKRGPDTPGNRVTCCCACNTEKGDMPYDVFLWYREMRVLGYLRPEILAWYASLSAIAEPWPS